MIRLGFCVCSAALLIACTPPAPAKPAEVTAPVAVAAEIPQPSESRAEAFPDCTWGPVTAGGLSIWSYACPTVRIIADDALPGFQRETTDPDGKVSLYPVIQIFTKPADAPIDAIIDRVRTASPGSETCNIEPGSHDDFVLMPTGEAALAYAQFIEGKADGPSLPCGPYGPSEAGGRTFRLVDGAPDKVVMIDWGTEIQVFEPDTLAVASAPG
jgi:hypothetical protein